MGAPPNPYLALKLTRELQVRARTSPVDHIAWLPLQERWLSHDDERPYLLRSGRRQGKSTAGAAELIFRCRASHPFKRVRQPTPERPIRCALVTLSKGQGVEIQRVLHDLIPPQDLLPGLEFSPSTGFRGHRPVIRFKNRSEIVIYSGKQGADAMSGAEFDFMLLDEPPHREVYDQCLDRVRNVGGHVGLTLTPIDGPPLPWLRELAEEGLVADYWSRLTPESQIPRSTGRPRTTKNGVPWDQSFIDKIWRKTNALIAPVTIDGEWEMRSEGQFFSCFDPQKHVSTQTPREELEWYLGVDFASADRELGMCVVLSGVRRYSEVLDGHTYSRVSTYVLDEIVCPGTTSMEQLARSINRMLTSHGLQWRHLDGAWADNRTTSRFTTSSPRELERWVAHLVGVPQKALMPRISSVKEGVGGANVTRRTKDIRCRWAFGEIAANRVIIHPRCAHLIKSLLEWDYSDAHPLKDVSDAWLYGLRTFWQSVGPGGPKPAAKRT